MSKLIIPKLKPIILLTFAFGILLTLPQITSAQIANRNPEQLKKITVDEHLGDHIPLDLHFTDFHGKQVTLKDYFKKGRPVLLTLNYYNCPMLCPLVLTGVSKAAAGVKWTPGNEYQIVTVSIAPDETPKMAADAHDTYLAKVGKKGDSDGWAFLVGKKDQIQKLAKAVGFHYYYNKENGQYNHPAVSFVLGDDGKITRYLYGLDRDSNNLKLALLEATKGKIGNTVDRIILYCCQYDPNAGGYVVVAAKVMNVGGVLTVIILGAVLGIYWYREKHKEKDSDTAEAESTEDLKEEITHG